MPKIVINPKTIRTAQAGRTINAFADDLGISRSSLSRVLAEKAEASNRLIATLTARLPYRFDEIFVIEDAD